MTIAAYVRVSSRGQKDDSQRAEIEKWLDRNGIDRQPLAAQTRDPWAVPKHPGPSRPAPVRVEGRLLAGRREVAGSSPPG